MVTGARLNLLILLILLQPLELPLGGSHSVQLFIVSGGHGGSWPVILMPPRHGRQAYGGRGTECGYAGVGAAPVFAGT